MRSVLLSLLLVGGLVAAASCAARGDAGESLPREPLVIRVVNRNWADMRVYLARDGQRALLGLVTTGTTATFTAPPDLVGAVGSLRLVADPVGARTVFTSEPFQAEAGRTVEWTIRVRPAHSALVVY